jgi:dynein heavy chain
MITILKYFNLYNILLGFDIIEKLTKVNVKHLHSDCMELFAYFNQKLIDSLVKCTRKTLEMMKKMVGSSR